MPAISEPRVTVYITNHNYGCFIDQAIQSVLNQTLQDFELIIIDDGSTDNSRDIIERYADHPKTTVVFQENKGLNVSNNIALRAARGRCIMRLDADDYLDENALTVLAGALDRNPDVGLVFPDYYLIDEGGVVLGIERRHDFAEGVTLLDQPAHGACTLIRRECLLELGGYDEVFECQDGYELWIRFIEHYNVQNVNLPLFYYRQHPRSLTQDESRILETRGRIMEKYAKRSACQLDAIAIVPVRGPSADPNSLALEELGGKRLIDWTLQAALVSERLSAVLVSSPDTDLLAHVTQHYGDRVLAVRRDRDLALANTHIEATLCHALHEFGETQRKPDAVMTLYVEAPFRSTKHIDQAIDVMQVFDVDAVIAVHPETDLFFQHDGHGLKPAKQAAGLRLERENLYRQVGGLQLVRRSYFEAQNEIVGGRVGHVVLDQRSGLMIQSDLDWELAQFLATERSGQE